MRDDKPFGGPAPPAAAFYYARDRASEHPKAHLASYTPVRRLQRLWQAPEPGRLPGPIFEGSTPDVRWPIWPRTPVAKLRAKSRQRSPLTPEAVRWIGALFDIERTINGRSAERRKAIRQELSAQLVADLEAWMREHRAKLSRCNDVAKAMDYTRQR